MNGVLVPLLVVGIILLIIGILIFAIKRKLNSLTRQYLGKNLGETAQMLSNGLREEVNLPKSITNLTALYQPQIDRDFPTVGYQRMEAMARSGLVNVLNAIEAENLEKGCVPDASPKLYSQLKGIIADNKSKKLKVTYDDVKIHKSSIARYNSTEAYANADFEISYQCLYHAEDEQGKVKEGSKTQPGQYACRVGLSYNQASAEDGDLYNSAFTSNCPNCGAPVSVVGGNRVCKYCGSHLGAVEERIWQINSFNLIKS